MQPRRLASVTLVMLSTPWTTACAKGSGLGDDTVEENGDATSAGGGAGGKAQSSTQASTSASSVNGAGGFGGAECAERPCKLVAPQCGCDSGESCSIQQPTLSNPSGRVCAPVGTAMIAESC